MGAPIIRKINTQDTYSTSLVTLSTITPIPSATLSVFFNGAHFPITCDSGATVSFVDQALVRRLRVPMLPNGQLAQLAIPKVRAASLGEINIVVIEASTSNICLRLRALVMPSLSVPCYGGRTFEHDNGICDDVNTMKVSIHHGRFTVDLSEKIGPLPLPQPPPTLTVSSATDVPVPTQSKERACVPLSAQSTPPSQTQPLPPSQVCTPVLMKEKASVLPHGLYPIPCKQPPGSKVLVLPPTPLEPSSAASLWPPQVCDVASGSALYVNQTESPLYHAKHTHFRLLQMEELPVTKPVSCPVNLLALTTPSQPSADSILAQIKINSDVLSAAQLQDLHTLHRKHLSAFNEDMSGGFQDADHPYYATFAFKDENRTPPHKVWAPQFNRKCQDLMQAKCDELEHDGILADPSKVDTDVRLVSPTFIQQKGSAKHKPLAQCSLNEIRFITCFNSLNDSIHPVSGRSNSYNDIMKYMASQPYCIHADLTSSYFQVKVHKKFWKYMGVMTPYRGIRVLTRLGQGLLNSDVHLEQVVTRVLGDEMLKGMCIIARDDLIVGATSIEKCLANWALILAKLDEHNLKLNPRKVRVLLQDTEIYGHKVQDGKVRPSDHIVTSLAATTTDSLVTVKQVNSWKGLYKTLIRHLPNLASVMAPFDAACAGQPSSDKFDWTRPGILAAFNAATKHLDQVMETYLPHPDEQLALKPDTSEVNLCSGWVMNCCREVEGTTRWLPVQYASAKLHNYMSTWTPCEQEGVGTVLAIDQTRHWINESSKPTLVLPDNKPVVEAADLMRRGKHSKNPRLQSFLASVNRSNVIFRHNSAKAGLHDVPDALSRRPPKPCTSKDCQVERFLSELPARVELMPITLQTIALESLNPAQLAAAGDMQELLGKGTGPIPLGSRETWIALQADCEDCCKFLLCKRLGQVPTRKDKNKTAVNRLLKTCEVSKGLIISRSFDPALMRETERVYVPSMFLPAILTVMHARLVHPLPTQLQRIFEKYFVGFGVQGLCNTISEECSLCVANKRFPRELDQFSPSSDISHPGSHMGTDVMKRAGQQVVITCDRFSNFVTATIAQSEKREDMIQAILTTVTPIRHAAKVEVRTDRATSLQSLANRPDQQLLDNGIVLVLGEHANRNSNCSVDKSMQELEGELKRLDPVGGKLTPGLLSQAVTNLNDRIRGHGLSASQLHFSRDHITGRNLALRDSRFKEMREIRRERGSTGVKVSPSKSVKPGQLVHIKAEGTKHCSRNPLVVTSDQGRTVTVQRMLRATPAHAGFPKIQSDKLDIDKRFLSTYKQPIVTRSDSKDWRADMYSARRTPQLSLRPAGGLLGSRPVQQPTKPPDDSEEDEDGGLCVVVVEEEGEEGAFEDEVGMIEAEAGEVEEDEGDDVGEAALQEEEVGAVEEAVLNLPLPELMQGPRKRRRPPREQWIINPRLQQVDANPPVVQAEADDEPDQPRVRRQTKPPDYLGIEKDRGGQLDLSPPLAAQLLDLPSSLTERMLTPTGPTPTSSCSPTPPTTPLVTPVATPDTSPETLNVAPPRLLPQGQDIARDVLERHRHWSIGGGETEQERLYPMLEWAPRSRHPPPSC